MSCCFRTAIACFACLIVAGWCQGGELELLSLDAWETPGGEPAPGQWEVVDGVLHLDPKGQRIPPLLSKEGFGDFELEFEWRIAEGGNSGLKYRVRYYGKRLLGCEYQLLDDANRKPKLTPTKSAGALYDLYAPDPVAKRLQPAGEWNHARIVVRGDHIEHWMNGRKIVEATVGGPDWQRRIAASKFAKVEGFGQRRQGRLMLQSHRSEAWIRNMRLRRLDAE